MEHQEHTFRICSKSSLNSSATDAIQNFRNFSFKAFSFAFSASVLGFTGITGGRVVSGGEGERRGVWFEGPDFTAWTDDDGDELDASESESGSETSFTGGAGRSSPEVDDEGDDEDDEDTFRRLRFLWRFRIRVGGIRSVTDPGRVTLKIMSHPELIVQPAAVVERVGR